MPAAFQPPNLVLHLACACHAPVSLYRRALLPAAFQTPDLILRLPTPRVRVPVLLQACYAKYCLHTLEGMMSSRTNEGIVPTLEEIQAYKERPPILATIELVNGALLTEDLPVAPDLNVKKVGARGGGVPCVGSEGVRMARKVVFVCLLEMYVQSQRHYPLEVWASGNKAAIPRDLGPFVWGGEGRKTKCF